MALEHTGDFFVLCFKKTTVTQIVKIQEKYIDELHAKIVHIHCHLALASIK